jgi:hypothetical protein
MTPSTTSTVRARLLAACSQGSGDWLDALPLSSDGLKMDNATIRIATNLRHGAPVVRPHVCVCGMTVTVDGHHGLSCRHDSGRHSRHDQVNDLLARAFISTGTLTTREPHSLCTNSGKRPDGVTRCRGEEGGAWHGTRSVRIPSPFPIYSLAVRMLVQRQSLKRFKNTPTSLTALTPYLSPLKHLASGVNKRWS